MPGPFAARFLEGARRDPVVIAVDEPVEEAARILGGIPGPLNLKVGWAPLLRAGVGAISAAKDLARGGLVIADVKIADVPHVSGAIARELADAGADGVIVHGFPGPDVVAEVIRSAHGAGVLVVVEMSNPGALLCYQGCAERLAEVARDAGADGIVAPATRPDRISALRRVVGDGMIVVAPGVGAQGGSAYEAVLAGADAVIVGRSITSSKDPMGSLSRIRDEALRGLRLRLGSR